MGCEGVHLRISVSVADPLGAQTPGRWRRIPSTDSWDPWGCLRFRRLRPEARWGGSEGGHLPGLMEVRGGFDPRIFGRVGVGLSAPPDRRTAGGGAWADVADEEEAAGVRVREVGERL